MNISDFITFDEEDIDIDLTESDLDDLDLDVLPTSIQDLLDDAEVEAEEVRETDWETDSDHTKFMPYAITRLKNIPKHNGTTTVGCERAISYLRKLDKEISRAIQSDDKNVIDEVEAEKLRDKVFDFIEKLEAAHDKISNKKRKKTASLGTRLDGKIFVRIAEGGIPEYFAKVEANGEEVLLQMEMAEPSDLQVQAYMEWESGKITKTADTARIMLVADPFLHEVSNIIMRAHQTYGRNIEDVYHELSDKYKFTDRDHLAVHALLREKNFLIDRDFITLGDKLETGREPIGMKVYPA